MAGTEQVQLICLGSFCGDDRAGWFVADEFEKRPCEGATVQRIGNPTELIEIIDPACYVFIVDAARSNLFKPGVIKFQWPEFPECLPKLQTTHSLTLHQSLQLAEVLDRLPKLVLVYALLTEGCSRSEGPGPTARKSIELGCSVLRRDIGLALQGKPVPVPEFITEQPADSAD